METILGQKGAYVDGIYFCPHHPESGFEGEIKELENCNIFADLEEAYPMISEESIIARAPQVILLPMSNGVTVEDVKARAGWENIPAVVNDRIYLINDNLYSRPAPRIADVVLDLSELLTK